MRLGQEVVRLHSHDDDCHGEQYWEEPGPQNRATWEELAGVGGHWTLACRREGPCQLGKMIGPEVGVAGTRVFGGFPRVQGVELVDLRSFRRKTLDAMQGSFRV